MTEPTISVVIPAAVDSSGLTDTIQSVVAQTYPNIDLLVVGVYANDSDLASGTRAVEYHAAGGRSISAALSYGITQAKGDYILWLLPGDRCRENAIEGLIGSVNDVEVCFSATNNFHVIEGGSIPRHDVGRILKDAPEHAISLYSDIKIDTRAMLLPRDTMSSVRFDEGVGAGCLTELQYSIVDHLLVQGVGLTLTEEPSGFVLGRHNAIHETEECNDDKRRADTLLRVRGADIDKVWANDEEAGAAYKKLLDNGLLKTAALAAYYYTLTLEKLNGINFLSTIVSELPQEVALPPELVATMGGTKKRIMFSSAHWLTGGMERVMSLLFVELKDEYEIYLITPHHEGESQIKIPGFVRHIQIGEAVFSRFFSAAILTYAKYFNVDVVIGFINLFDKQLDLYRITRDTGVKTIASNHEYYFYPYRSKHHYSIVNERIDAFKQSDAVVWPNNFSAVLCHSYAGKSFVIGNPVSFDIKSTTRKNSTKSILCVGRFNDPVKRIDRMLETFAQVKREVPEARLTLVGKYELDAAMNCGEDATTTLRENIERLAIPQGAIEFVGEVNDVDNYYKRADVLLLTSTSEGFGMVINEAACFGVPTVCGYFPGVEDIITSGVNGYVVPQDENMASSAAAHLVSILRDNRLRVSLGNQARATAKEYTPQSIGQRWRTLISNLIDGSSEVRRSLTVESLQPVPLDGALVESVLLDELNEVINVFVADQKKEEQAHRGRARKAVVILRREGVKGLVGAVARKVLRRLTR